MSPSVHPGPRGLRPLTRLLVALLLLSPLTMAIANRGTTEVERAVAEVGAPATRTAPTAPATNAEDAPVTKETPAARPVESLPQPMLGFAINCHHIGDLALYLRSVDSIAELGANTLLVVTPMYQRRVDSNRIRFLRDRCPTDEQLTAILERAKQNGLRTVLLPIVLIEKPGDRDWRGLIRPNDWDEWWASYDDFIDRFAGIASRADVDLLAVGSELNSTEKQVHRWEAVARRVRAGFDGAITYSANWDRYEKVELWPLVDVMSVSSYFELERDRPGAPEPDLVRAWAPIRTRLLAAARKHEKPLLLIEVGYPSLPWANAHPWNYVATDDAETDHAAQARSWRAFFAAWSPAIADPSRGMLGFCGYRWDPYHAGDEKDTGYGIVGKPARDVIRAGFAGIREAVEGAGEVPGGSLRSSPATLPRSAPASQSEASTDPTPRGSAAGR